MDLQKAINYTKQAIKIAKTDEDFELCAKAILKIENELKKEERGYVITNNSIFRDYSKEGKNTRLKRLIR